MGGGGVPPRSRENIKIGGGGAGAGESTKGKCHLLHNQPRMGQQAIVSTYYSGTFGPRMEGSKCLTDAHTRGPLAGTFSLRREPCVLEFCPMFPSSISLSQHGLRGGRSLYYLLLFFFLCPPSNYCPILALCQTTWKSGLLLPLLPHTSSTLYPTT